MYPSEIKDKDWEKVKDFLQPSSTRGKPRKHEIRSVLNAIFYIAKTGCQWRMLPNDFPRWDLVYKNFERWNKRGVWEKVLQTLNRQARIAQGRKEYPTYGILDSQSVKTDRFHEEVGFDGGKKN